MKQPFSQQKGGQRRSTLAEMKKIIAKQSGGDVVGLMKALLETRFWQKSMRKKDKKDKVVKTEGGDGSLPMLLADGSNVVVESIASVSEDGAALVVSETSSSAHQPSQSSQSQEPLQVINEKQEDDDEEEDDEEEEIGGEIGGIPLLPIHNSHVKLEKVGKVILNLYNNATNYNKRQWASILAPILTYKEMKHLGFSISNQTYARAREHARECGAGAPVPPPTTHPRKREGDDEDIELQEQHLDEASQSSQQAAQQQVSQATQQQQQQQQPQQQQQQAQHEEEEAQGIDPDVLLLASFPIVPEHQTMH